MELERAIADLRNDIARSGPGLVKVFRDQLTRVLDALEPVQLEVETPANTPIKQGDTVELAFELLYYGTRYPVGTKGTVLHVYETAEDNYPIKVKILTTGTDINFNRHELRKVA